MSIFKSAVQKPITTAMVFVAVVVMGVFSVIQLPIDLYPEIEPPYISVMTTYAGASAADIEVNVTKLIEDRLASVDKLKEITSSSYDNMSVVNLEFQWEANLDVAVSDVRNALDWVLDALPDDADRPSVFKFNTSMMPILFYSVTADNSYSGLERILDEKVVNALNRIDGIGSVSVVGVPQRVVYIDLMQSKMDAYNLTIEQIGNVIAAENLNMPSGNVKMGTEDYQLRVEGEFDESYEIPELVVGSSSGKNIYLKDVASVRDTIKDITLDQRVDGRQGVRMMVTKQSGANTVKIARSVKAELEKLKPSLPPDIVINEEFDSSTFIVNSINNLTETLMYALIFVILVVLVFLGRWRATLIIALTIPLSLICAFIYLFFTGNSLNIISLSSLSIAIGMVVDDAIVVLENISRHVERGSSPREAAIYATNEVWLSVIVTTLVIVAVFVPLTMVSGVTGVMFKQLGWIVTITVVTSTMAAISITPMLSSRLLKGRAVNRKIRRFSYENTIEKWLGAFDNWYGQILGWCITHKKVVVAIVILIFSSSLFLLKYVGTDFMPEADQGRISVMIELQTGTRVEETMKTIRSFEAVAREKYPEIKLISSSAGSNEDGGVSALFNTNGTNISNTTFRLKDLTERKRNHERSIFTIADEMRKDLKKYPEIINYNVSTAEGGGGMMGGNTVDIEIFGYDFDRTNTVAMQIRDSVATLKGAENIQISRKNDRPELQIKFDREKLMQHGLNSAMVSMYVRNRVDGMIASKLREEGQEYDIIVRLEENSRNSISKLEEMTLTTPLGKQIKLSELGKVGEYWSPPNIAHKRKERIVTVSVTPVNIPLGELAENIQTEINKIEIPNDLMVHIGGAYEDQQESFMNLALLLLLSLILVFIVMASQFESFSNPFVIMFSIPFAFSGSFLALYLTGTTLNLIAALGMVLLVGIVVKNGIVLVDYINLMRDRGMHLNEAIKVSGRSRLRPVLMTSLTTILGMMPMALSSGEGAEIWAPMGISVIGGLTFSTLITLIIIPVMYAIVSRSGERDKIQKIRKRFKFMDENGNKND
jgi:HAE1 family hydrophobic/amphiphilic exporter-1